MHKYLKNQLTLTLLVLCLFASACISTKAKGATVDKIYWKTHAVGRYLIDLPMDAKVIYQNEYSGRKYIWRKDLTPETAMQEAQAKIEKYKAIPHEEIKGASQFIESFPLPGGGIVVNRWDEPYVSSMSVMECYLISQDSKRRVFYVASDVGNDKFDFARKKYTEIAQSIYAYDDWEPVPTDAGFIFAGGIIKRDTSHWVREEAKVVFRFKEWAGIGGIFYSDSFEDSDKPELKKDDRLSHLESVLFSSTLKKGDCTIAGREAQEYCVAATEEERRKYNFLAEAPNHGKDIANPRLHLKIYSLEGVYNTGNGFESDDEALAVWNTIRNSIRLRPGAI